MIHGEFEPTVAGGHVHSAAQLDAFAGAGHRRSRTTATARSRSCIPLDVAFGNPDLLERSASARCSQSLGAERAVPERRADRQLAAQRPLPGAEARDARPERLRAPVDQPGLLHGRRRSRRDRRRARPRPRHADLQRAAPRVRAAAEARRSRTITGERPTASRRSADRPGHAIDDPNILDFVELRDARRQRARAREPGGQEEAVTGVRRTTLAARLKAIYGNVDKLDAFVGMVSEQHVAGHRVRRAPARDLEEAVRGAARRRPLLLPQRSRPPADPAAASGSTTATRSPS